jgi:hypothetical protein
MLDLNPAIFVVGIVRVIRVDAVRLRLGSLFMFDYIPLWGSRDILNVASIRVLLTFDPFACCFDH